MNWNPIVAILRLLAPYLIGAAIFGGVVGYIHHSGYVSGEHKADKALAAAQARVTAADARSAQYSKAFADVNAALAAEAAQRAQQAQDARKAIAAATVARKHSDDAFAAWRARYARTAPQCVGLSADNTEGL